ncbi:hypothetical protein [Pseudaeromonas paramecii]|uniref:Head-tail adaptor protein n=1 Tax=Pseudaeromonas paramecii TaxID=2138166 RepID=A0ABP8PVV8_9GAMM
MAITLDEIELPEQLDWQDEFFWAPVAQTITPTLTGYLIVEENAAPMGRPITLVSDGGVWAPRALVKAVKAKEAQVNTPMTLTLHDGRQFKVVWRRDDKGVDASQIIRICDPDDTDLYDINLRFTEID